MFRPHKSLPSNITPDQVEGARILRDASMYLWETLEELRRHNHPETVLDYHLMVGRRQAIIKLNNHQAEHFSCVPRGAVYGPATDCWA